METTRLPVEMGLLVRLMPPALLAEISLLTVFLI